ncbi:P-loop NTPase, partial [candidate division KSB1 bacterium]
MIDQAARLREIATEIRNEQDNAILVPEKKKLARAQVFSITSGKGGVGKSNIALNLALKMKDSGYNVLLVDA